jgi:hypothetical protein
MIHVKISIKRRKAARPKSAMQTCALVKIIGDPPNAILSRYIRNAPRRDEKQRGIRPSAGTAHSDDIPWMRQRRNAGGNAKTVALRRKKVI